MGNDVKIAIDRATHRKLKIYAAIRGVRMRDLIPLIIEESGIDIPPEAPSSERDEDVEGS